MVYFWLSVWSLKDVEAEVQLVGQYINEYQPKLQHEHLYYDQLQLLIARVAETVQWKNLTIANHMTMPWNSTTNNINDDDDNARRRRLETISNIYRLENQIIYHAKKTYWNLLGATKTSVE